MAKNIFIAATDRDVGKSTISFALIEKLMESGKKVGFMKPLGQRWLPSPWGRVEEDVILMKEIFQFQESPRDMNPVVIKKGFTEEYLSRMIKPDLGTTILNAYKTVSRKKDYLIIEGTGHAGVGAVLDKSNADVAKILGADVILVVKGGIGSAIDRLELNRTFFEHRRVNVVGIIVNKVLPSKYDRVTKSIGKYCKKNKIKLFGIIPYSPILSHPTLGQVIDELVPEIIYETDDRRTVIDNFIVGASTVDEFVEFIEEKKGNMILVFPAVRLDIIFAIPNLKKVMDMNGKRILAVLFSGKCKPSKIAITTLKDENINILWVGGDTFSVISALSSISIKTRPQDSFKIEEIKNIVIKNIDYHSILERFTLSKLPKTFFKRMRDYFFGLMKRISLKLRMF